MENATKALVIAATVLIAVLILSVGIYVFNHYMGFAYKNEENRAKQALVQYNTKFEKYIDKELTIQDVLTIVNLANDYNKRKSVDEIAVTFNNINAFKIKNGDWINYLENDKNSYKIKNDQISEYYSDGTIKKIEIIRNYK